MSRDEAERILRRVRERPGAQQRIEREVGRMEVEQERVPSYDELAAALDKRNDELDLALDLASTAEFERDEARRLARWLYEHGGQQVLDASGGGDTSEWPWLREGDGPAKASEPSAPGRPGN